MEPEHQTAKETSSAPRAMGSTLRREIILLVLVLAVPIIPFVLWHDAITSWADAWREHPQSRAATATISFLLLTSDIFLPVPSSVVGTFAGAQLGTWLGSLVVWLGLTMGSCVGFQLARLWGAAARRWFVGDEEQQALSTAVHDSAPWILLFARGVPVFAEATVLWFGAQRIAWRSFLPAVLLGNAVLALSYCALGDWAADREWLPTALIVAAAAPLLLLLGVRRFLIARS